MIFRPASLRDVDQIMECVSMMIDGTAFEAPQRAKIERLVASGRYYHEGAWLDGKLVGFMCGHLSETFLNNQVNAYDNGLYVVPEHRGGSLAVRLIRNFESWAKAQGAQNIWICQCVAHEIDSTRRFFERLGYECQGFSMRKRA